MEVNAVPFHLVGADDATVVYMEDNPQTFPVADPSKVVAKVRSIKAAVEQASAASDEKSLEEFHSLARAAGIELCLHELLTLARQFGRQDGFKAEGIISISKLVAAL